MKNKNLDLLAEELTRDEGFRKFPYFCSAGKQTIGIGRNIEQRGISRDEAVYMLKNDIQDSIAAAEHFPWYTGLNDVRKRVVVNMIFNLGMPTFKKFRGTIAAIHVGDWPEAKKQMLDSRWARQVGVRAKRLSNMMLTGEI